eukprot:Pgem_evm1s2646
MLLTTCGMCNTECGFTFTCKTCKSKIHKQCPNVENDPDYENTICNSCMKNSTTKETGMAHKYFQCNNYVHSFCSDHEQNQSLGTITCNKYHDDYCS